MNKKQGKAIRLLATGRTWRDHRGMERDLWRYLPTDTPNAEYTSADMAEAMAVCEHGKVRIVEKRAIR